MSSDLNIQLSPQAFVGLLQAATASGRTPAEEAAAALEQTYSAPDGASKGVSAQQTPTRFERDFGSITAEPLEKYFGSIDMGHPIGTDNEQIDADLAREYGRIGDGD